MRLGERKGLMHKQRWRVMFCNKCGKDNVEGAQFCASCGDPIAPVPGYPPAGRPRTSGMAIASLVLGILGYFLFGVPALVGLALGIVSLVQINGSQGRLGGRGLAIAGICVSSLFILVVPAVLLPGLAREREMKRGAACRANLHTLAIAVRMYRVDEGGYPPPYDPATGQGGLSVLLSGGYLSGPEALRCPDDPTSLSEYNATHGTNWDARQFSQWYSSYNQTYNYWGYERQGTPLERQADAEPLYADKVDRLGRPLWLEGQPTAVFPGLANRNAPDNTIVVYCPRHSRHLASGAREDLVLRLDGSVTPVSADAYDWVGQAAVDRPPSAE